MAHLPTPLEVAPRLARAIGVRSLYLKRDDLTGLALGGNKARQLEYLLGDARARGATAIITAAGVESNHCRQIAAACARLGLRAHLILRGAPQAIAEANLLLATMLGAELRYLPAGDFYRDVAHVARSWSAELTARGDIPYFVDTVGWDSASLGIAALGYVRAAVELEEQFDRDRWRPDAIYLCSGAATQAGLIAAAAALGSSHRIVGFSASPFIPNKPDVISKVATRAARALGLDLTVAPRDVVNLDDQIGPGYGVNTPASLEALRMAARTEGLLLDPTYTAKALAGLVAHVRDGTLDPGSAVLFLHTGGTPNLFLSRNAADLESAAHADAHALP